MGCAASATTKLTSVVPLDSDKETVLHETRKEAEEAENFKYTSEALTEYTPKVLFQVSDKDQIDFDDSELELCQSFEWPKEDQPRGVALPPGRMQHEVHLRRVEKFMRAARKHKDHFKQFIGRRSSGSSVCSNESFLD